LFFFQAEDGIRDYKVTGVQTCALPIYMGAVVTVLAAGIGGVVGMLVGGGIGAHKTDMWEAVPSSRWHVNTLPTGPGRFAFALSRSEERRVGKECRSRWVLVA